MIHLYKSIIKKLGKAVRISEFLAARLKNMGFGNLRQSYYVTGFHHWGARRGPGADTQGGG